MIRKRIMTSLLAGLILTSCSKIDNYVAPNGGIRGKLIDKITNEGLQAEQPNGFTVKLFEKGGKLNSPIAFQGKPDGTFENAFVFQNEYKVLVTEGAFFPIDTAVITIGASTENNFEVVPFLAITDATVTPAAGKVTVNYRLKRAQVGDKIVERKVLVSRVPTVNNSVFDFKAQTELAAVSDTDILAGMFSDEVTGLSSGQTYYVRIAARTNNPLKKYNYSKIFTVKVP
ncbi:DUF3823 domain-containing protein [Larkinella insperata]|uniref:DUF3823 domain-containing protein n=1 Tax=Larkinella insperata TaxID=332158 RepID=A0ABW3QNM0_9BACT|nr:DUF3823 domain-containing protein [Larkinella insperata]